jgi:hypothetical protein
VGLLEKRAALNHFSGPLPAFDNQSDGNSLNSHHKPVTKQRQQWVAKPEFVLLSDDGELRE